MSARIVEQLPAPRPGSLTLYVFGPGRGESLVLALPDGDWVVVDTCRQDDHHLALELLERFAPARLALAVLTHPDADHYRGFAELVDEARPDLIWTFPHLVSRKELLAHLARADPTDERARELSDALEVVDLAMQVNRGSPVHALQRRRMGDVKVHCLGPCPADVAHEQRHLRELLNRAARGEPITDASGHLVRGRAFAASGNSISLMLLLEWNGMRFCLAGDVEAPDHDHRGWNGIIDYVTAEGGVNLLTDLHMIKLAHHASAGAFSARAFDLHAQTRRIHAAIATPFAGRADSPPHTATLQRVRTHVRELAITARPACSWASVEGSGWHEVSRSDESGASCVVAACTTDGTLALTVHGGARSYR